MDDALSFKAMNIHVYHGSKQLNFLSFRHMTFWLKDKAIGGKGQCYVAKTTFSVLNIDINFFFNHILFTIVIV